MQLLSSVSGTSFDAYPRRLCIQADRDKKDGSRREKERERDMKAQATAAVGGGGVKRDIGGVVTSEEDEAKRRRKQQVRTSLLSVPCQRMRCRNRCYEFV